MNSLSKAGALTLLAVACLTIMVGCVIVPGLPSIARHLGVANASGWLVTLPSLGVVIFGPAAGKLTEKIGLYRSLCVGLFFYGLLGTSGAFMQGHWMVFANRLLLGAATAVVMSTGTGLISAFYQGENRMRMIARQGMSIEIGGVIFLFIGGLLATMGWRWPFCLYLFAWVMLAMVLAFVPGKEVDTIASHTEHSATQSAGKAVKLTFFAALFSMIVFFTVIINLPLHFHSLGFSEAQTGYFLSFVSLIAVTAAWLMPGLVTRLSEFGTLTLAFAFYLLAHLLFAFAPSMPLLVLGAVALGCGFGFSIPLVNHLIVDLSPQAQRTTNLARLSMAIFLGQFLSAFMAYLSHSTETIFLLAAMIDLVVLVILSAGRRHVRE